MRCACCRTGYAVRRAKSTRPPAVRRALYRRGRSGCDRRGSEPYPRGGAAGVRRARPRQGRHQSEPAKRAGRFTSPRPRWIGQRPRTGGCGVAGGPPIRPSSERPGAGGCVQANPGADRPPRACRATRPSCSIRAHGVARAHDDINRWSTHGRAQLTPTVSSRCRCRTRASRGTSIHDLTCRRAAGRTSDGLSDLSGFLTVLRTSLVGDECWEWATGDMRVPTRTSRRVISPCTSMATGRRRSFPHRCRTSSF